MVYSVDRVDRSPGITGSTCGQGRHGRQCTQCFVKEISVLLLLTGIYIGGSVFNGILAP